ncbi:phosphopantetheine-binding protein [Promicromonospora sp. NPDC057488]|uniref:phosphopantetheine-binding protein n=1 Tax=Promicromonospora sp. NPDC057488 TaxID=3346147 RepID=UPI00366C9B58
MTNSQIDLEPIIRPYLPLLGSETPLSPDDRLSDLGLDSLGTVGLLIELEDAFAVSIPDELLTSTTFDTASSLRQVIEALREAAID